MVHMHLQIMENFKKATKFAKVYDLTQEIYEEETGCDWPYSQNNSYYAICPLCDNPIRIIGLKTNNPKKRIYGAHAGKDIEGLAKNCVASMKECDNYKGGKVSEIKPSLTIKDQPVKEILSFMRHYYDVILSVVEEESGVYISKQLARNLLSNYIKKEAWCFWQTRETNIPWILLDATNSFNIFGRPVKKGSELLQVLENMPDIEISKSFMDDCKLIKSSNKNKYYIYFFHGLRYNQTTREEEMKFDLVEKDFRNISKIIYIKHWKMRLNINSFVDKCEYADAHPETRNRGRLRIAEELITDEMLEK